jgi:two-component system, NarL family, response regulator DevR
MDFITQVRSGKGRRAGAAASNPDAVLRNGSEVKIFLIEDSAMIRERLVEMINDIGGFEIVGEATTFGEAVSGILRTRPDIGIFDVQLAEGSGIDALAETKRRLPDMRGIVLTNYATPQHEKASIEAGAEYFLDKSGEIERITGILESMKATSSGGRQ